MEELVREGERVDDLERNGLKIIQDPGRFCFGMDAVLLSGFVHVKQGANVLDMGTGTGIIPILLSAKTEASHITGLEIQHESADMALRSVMLNSLEERINIVEGDIKEAGLLFPKAGFDAITCNPPYMIGEHGLKNPDSAMAIARHEILCTFEDVAREAATLLKPGGSFFLVHRPFRLAEIITTLVSHKLEPKRMQFVYPFVDQEPNMVLIEAVRGGRSRLTVNKPLIIYKSQGEYTDEIYDIYGY
ncbi:MAG: tRNA1(Val) (adenine(37)-N6)-methyltransferase [Lachnospiraceae bacterium]|nr:tRNA1(Val) (adenine(37)-N6)-methyltransferase [Lachnospiraceae bacterium]